MLQGASSQETRRQVSHSCSHQCTTAMPELPCETRRAVPSISRLSRFRQAKTRWVIVRQLSAPGYGTQSSTGWVTGSAIALAACRVRPAAWPLLDSRRPASSSAGTPIASAMMVAVSAARARSLLTSRIGRPWSISTSRAATLHACWRPRSVRCVFVQPPVICPTCWSLWPCRTRMISRIKVSAAAGLGSSAARSYRVHVLACKGTLVGIHYGCGVASSCIPARAE